jgi:flagellum-specific peptidoglycan hydrolase FlgJ
MRKLRRIAVLLLVFSSFFMTGCDINKVLDVVQKVAEGVQQAMPAIKDAVNTIQQAFPQDNKAAADDNQPANTAAPEQNTGNNANVTITTPGDQEDLAGNTTAAGTGSTGNGNGAGTGAATTAGTSTQNNGTGNNNNNNSGNNAAATSQAEAALANYKGGKLSPAEFGRLFGPVAREASRVSGVPASIIMAQAALETGWGASAIGSAKNLFGIKGTGPAGSVRVSTKEFRNGRMVSEMANFRKYNSWAESIADHGRLLQNSRYAKAMQNKNNPDQFARELQKAGYATDPAYASKLISIMKSNNFYQYNN